MTIALSQVESKIETVAVADDCIHVRLATTAEIDRWDEILARFDEHRIVHRRDWLDSLAASGRGKPIYILCTLDSEIVACLPGMLRQCGPFRWFGSPPIGSQTLSMGPVFDRHRVSAKIVMDRCVDFLERQQGVHFIELIAALDVEQMTAIGFEANPIETHRVELTPECPEAVLKRFKTSARRNVKRGLKLGLEVRLTEDESFVDEAYEQILEGSQRRGDSVSFSRRRVLEFFRHMKSSGNLLALSVHLPDDGPSIATGMFTIDGQELLLWQWAHRTKYRWYRATELMTWTAMQRGMEAGCRIFDLMGGGNFKKKFGAASDTSQHRWIRSRSWCFRQGRRLAEKCYRWQQLSRGWLRGRADNLTAERNATSP